MELTNNSRDHTSSALNPSYLRLMSLSTLIRMRTDDWLACSSNHLACLIMAMFACITRSETEIHSRHLYILIYGYEI